jgi:hypothetical protein
MADTDTGEAWKRFQADVKSLAGDLRRHYDSVSRDPEVRSGARSAAQSFGTALRETFHDVSSELEKAFRRSDRKK